MEDSIRLRPPCRVCGNWPCTCPRTFACHDCDRIRPVSEIAHDYVDVEDEGFICLDCLKDREQVMALWPSREVA